MAKVAAKKSAPKAVSKRTSRRKGVESWKTYIFRVLKQVHPETRISQKGMAIINNFVNYVIVFRFAVRGASLGCRCRRHRNRLLTS